MQHEYIFAQRIAYVYKKWLILFPVKVIFNLLRAQSFPCQQGCYNGLLVWRRQTILFPVPYAGFFMSE